MVVGGEVVLAADAVVWEGAAVVVVRSVRVTAFVDVTPESAVQAARTLSAISQMVREVAERMTDQTR